MLEISGEIWRRERDLNPRARLENLEKKGGPASSFINSTKHSTNRHFLFLKTNNFKSCLIFDHYILC